MKVLDTSGGMRVLAALALTMTAGAASANLYPEYISGVSLSVEKGIYTHSVELENIAASKQLQAMQLQPDKTHVDVDFTGLVSCAASNNVGFDHARAYFGPISLFLDSVQSPQTLFDAVYHPSFTSGKGNKRVTEAGNQQSFSIPLSQIKQGHPAIRFNPQEELNKELQQHLGQGGSAIDFYRQDHYITVSRTVSLAGWCKNTSSNTSRPAFASTSIDMTVIYKGDPDLIAPVQLSGQLAGTEMPGHIGHDLPLMLNSASFQPNMPHYIGRCVPETDPVIRINYSGNGKGHIRFRVEDNSNPVHSSGEIVYDSTTNMHAHHDFSYPLTAKLNQGYNAGWDTLNQTFTHPLSIKASVRDADSNTWSEWKAYGSANWNHRCVPQVAVQPGGGAGGFQADQPPGPAPASPSRVRPQAATPELDKIQPAPASEPSAPARIRAVEQEPAALPKR
ncbi:hypothetical protein [Halopseudomonas salegens]|uniref:Uncharacterized protein n=1 Tax=Halopseudomonas salegens TaxID=1434072 RepID=A0A1H2FJK6_9GAMM|nr:hypothetical protein [Halopseudomonas salegens]SDU07521.1 hypothetical protein SAMN05216210_1609 [Halopseudomonas salegens]